MALQRLCVLTVAVLLICCTSWRHVEAAVISIDLGSEWIKVALVKPGVPMEIVLNKESKRKTPAVMSLRNNDRLLGGPALNTAVKYPKSAYRYMQVLLGQKYNSTMVGKFMEWFPFYDIRKDEERGTVYFQHDQETTFSPEEVIAMLLNNSRHSAEDYAGVPIRDAVITVPTFFNQAQRKVVLHAAALVGLKVLQLMSNSAAAALNYGLFRQSSFNTTSHYVLFYDMGAVSTTATIVDYRKVQVKEGTLANVHPQLTVKGSGFSRILGGLEIDIKLQQHLAKNFDALGKTRNSVFDNPRAMAKLLKEAQRLKQVLSANTDHFAQIEGLMDEIDFRMKVTRSELEEMCSDLFDRIADPVKLALEAADMTMDEIDSVILVGGGTRVPKVQENLLKAVNKSDLGKSLNTDEATALGAVYQAAGHTKLFRVKKFIVKEGAVYPIQVSFDRVSQVKTISDSGEETEEEVVKSVKRTLFRRSSQYPTKKVLTFNRHLDDFSFQVLYGDLQFLSEAERRYFGRQNVSEFYLAGVADALRQHSKGEPKGIKAHFTMDESGLLFITNVESVFEYPENAPVESTLSKIGNTISSFFGMGGDDKEAQNGKTEEEEIPADANDTDTASDTKANTGGGGEQDAEEGTVKSETKAEKEASEENTREEDIEPPVAEDPQGTSEDLSEEDSGQEDSNSEQSDENREPEEASDDETISTQDGSDTEESPGEESEGDETDKEGERDKTPNSEEDQRTEETPETETPAGTINDTLPLNGSSNATNKTGKAKVPKEQLVKVNLTLETTVLDLPLPSTAATDVSIQKLVALYQRDEEKKANEKAKNALESHVFETKDAMYSEVVVEVSTEEQREVIVTALNEVGDWLEDEGYIAETKTYKDKLRELKRISRPLFKRVKEKELLPKALAKLASSINMSMDFLSRVRNLSSELTVLTEVEVTTLESLIKEIQEWALKKMKEQKAVASHEEPVLLVHEVEDQNKRLDREVMYLLNKIRSHPPPSYKSANKTNATDNNGTKSNSTFSEDPLGNTNLGGDDQSPETTPLPEEPTSPADQAGTEAPTEEPLELPGPGGDGNEQPTDAAPPDTDDTSTKTSDAEDSHKEL